MRRRLVGILVLVLVLAVLVANAAAAKDTAETVLWKSHCPKGAVVRTVPAQDWGGVHVLCISQLTPAEGGDTTTD